MMNCRRDITQWITSIQHQWNFYFANWPHGTLGIICNGITGLTWFLNNTAVQLNSTFLPWISHTPWGTSNKITRLPTDYWRETKNWQTYFYSDSFKCGTYFTVDVVHISYLKLPSFGLESNGFCLSIQKQEKTRSKGQQLSLSLYLSVIYDDK